MMRVICAFVAAFACIGVEAASQQQTAQTPSGFILGHVVDAVTNAPLHGVVVQIAHVIPPPAGAPRPIETRVLTDAQGRFLLRGLPAGTYHLLVVGASSGFSPSGFVVTGSGFPIGAYVTGGFGQRRMNGPLQAIELSEGQRLGEVEIRLWKCGAIGGRLIDEAGEPVVNQVIGAVQVNSSGRLLTGPTVRTDDRGAFRLPALAPGQYVVFVPQTQSSMPLSIGEELAAAPTDTTLWQRFSNANAPPPHVGGVRIGSSVVATTPNPVRFGPDALISNALAPTRQGDAVFVYQTTFFPSATRVAQATRITLEPGEERTDITVQMRPVRAGSITGVLMDEAGPVPHVGLHLMPADMGREASVLEAATTATDSRGGFSFPAVPVGQYTILAWRTGGPPSPDPRQPPPAPARTGEMPGAWARQSVAVGGQPTDNVTVTMRPPVGVTGRVVFEGSSAQPAASNQLPVTVWTVDPLFRTPGPSAGSVIDFANGGRINVRGVSPPGRFFFGPPPGISAPWTLQSIAIAGRDATDAAFDIGDGDVTDVVITYTDRPASLSGTVTAPGTAEPDPSVFLFPAAKTRWYDARYSTRTFRVARVTKSGTFTMTTLPPGDYLIVAIRDDAAGDWPDETFIAKLAAQATPIRINANQASTTTLKVSVIK